MRIKTFQNLTNPKSTSQPVLASASKNYFEFLNSLKSRIRTAQTRAALSVNKELIVLYWHIGQGILIAQKQRGWGTKVVERLSRDLSRAFPEMNGLSLRNLKYMRAFAEVYPKTSFVQQAAAQIPWFHNCVILDKIKDGGNREFYIRQTIDNGWSRKILVHQIKSGLHKRQGRAVTNFSKTLSPINSQMAQQLLKDPYTFDFLSLRKQARERDLHQALVEHLKEFLVELGVGFSFVGSQYHLDVGGEKYYLDLLFYHLRLRCYVAVELKMVKFEPEFAGKMNFYLAVLDDRLRHRDDQPSMGIILCKSKNKVIVEYSLRDTKRPLSVSAYHLTHSLPSQLKGQLPSVKQLKEQLNV